MTITKIMTKTITIKIITKTSIGCGAEDAQVALKTSRSFQ